MEFCAGCGKLLGPDSFPGSVCYKCESLDPVPEEIDPENARELDELEIQEGY